MKVANHSFQLLAMHKYFDLWSKYFDQKTVKEWLPFMGHLDFRLHTQGFLRRSCSLGGAKPKSGGLQLRLLAHGKLSLQMPLPSTGDVLCWAEGSVEGASWIPPPELTGYHAVRPVPVCVHEEEMDKRLKQAINDALIPSWVMADFSVEAVFYI